MPKLLGGPLLSSVLSGSHSCITVSTTLEELPMYLDKYSDYGH